MKLALATIETFQDQILHCDAETLLRSLPDNSIDMAFLDPPYPGIKRDYGYWTEDEWMNMMQGVVIGLRRVLKPKGSAAIVLQPNYEQIGRMRGWLWHFQLWCLEYWNVVQDAYAWNYAALPLAGAAQGLMRSSMKTVVWIGEPDCERNQSAVLWEPNKERLVRRLQDKAFARYPSGRTVRVQTMADVAIGRNGSTPFNCLPITNTDSVTSAGAHGHGAGTPEKLVGWWIKYLSKTGDIVVDPFMGSGTTALVARSLGRHFIGCDKEPKYVKLANDRIAGEFGRIAKREREAEPLQPKVHLVGGETITQDILFKREGADT